MINKKEFKFPYIIAEIGSNNNGSLAKAKSLIKAAKDAGCDAVKFQSWNENLYKRNYCGRESNLPDAYYYET